jgi:hypothetical protein
MAWLRRVVLLLLLLLELASGRWWGGVPNGVGPREGPPRILGLGAAAGRGMPLRLLDTTTGARGGKSPRSASGTEREGEGLNQGMTCDGTASRKYARAGVPQQHGVATTASFARRAYRSAAEFPFPVLHYNKTLTFWGTMVAGAVSRRWVSAMWAGVSGSHGVCQ